MDLQQRTNRFGWRIILCACILRLTVAGVPGMLLQWLSDRITVSPIYSETGRDVRFFSSSGEKTDHVRESPGPWMPDPKRVRYEAADLSRVQLDYDCTLRPDLEVLLQRPLDWNLRSEEPAVLIFHTHTTESYTKTGEVYTETTQYRTLDEEFNMLSVGDALADCLEESGIRVIHDRQVHDYPSYNGSYVHARKQVEKILTQYPSVQLVLDLHRDALEKDGKQLHPVLQSGGEAVAQMMLVVGTNVSRRAHENWEENLALALKLQIRLEQNDPGIMRPLNLRTERFNQDLHPQMLLVEVGAAGNTRKEALAAVRKLAGAVADLAAGTEIVSADGNGF